MPGQIVDIGHVTVYTEAPRELVDFYRKKIGLKLVIVGDVFNAFRVGTIHFCVMKGEPNRDVTFDFTSDDIRACRAGLIDKGVECTEIEYHPGSGHDWFSFLDPDGRRMTVQSYHYARHVDNCETPVYLNAHQLFLEAQASIRGDQNTSS